MGESGRDKTVASAIPWTRQDRLLMAGIVAVGIGVRVVLLPSQGFRDDLDQFVGWVHHIATHGLPTLYGDTAAGPVTFGPVMGFVLAALAAVDPAFLTATNASDEGIRILMKVPASMADVMLALVVAYALRRRPRWALVGAAAILWHPAVVDVSAWWGQYESIYLLFGAGAAVLAVEGRSGWAAAALALSLMSKPQAVPLLIPFAAWFWATGGPRAMGRAVTIGLIVTAATWLPFLAAGGPAGYLHNLGQYQGDIFDFLSLRAWNAWWLVQEAAAGGGFIRDDVPLAGPLTLRVVGYLAAVLLSLAIAYVIVRNPQPRVFFLGLAAAVLVFFSFATQMHERYAFGALVFLALLVAESEARWVALAFGITFTLNLLAAIPPTPSIGDLLPVAGPLGVIGSVAMLVITFLVFRMMATGPQGLDEAPGLP